MEQKLEAGARVRVNDNYGPPNPKESDGSMEATRGTTGTVVARVGDFIQVSLDELTESGWVTLLFEPKELDVVA